MEGALKMLRYHTNTCCFSRVQLFCDPTDCSPPGSSLHGIYQAKVLEWVAITFSRGSFWPWDWTCVSCIVRQILNHWATRERKVKKAQSCMTLCDPMDYNLLGRSVHGTLQTRKLEWVTFPFSRGSSWLRDRTQVSHITGGFFTVWATWGATT